MRAEAERLVLKARPELQDHSVRTGCPWCGDPDFGWYLDKGEEVLHCPNGCLPGQIESGARIFLEDTGKKGGAAGATVDKVTPRVTAAANGRHPEKLDDWLPLTDEGNAERLVHQHGADMRYCFERGEWLLWQKTHWSPDTTQQIEHRVVAMARNLLVQAANTDGKEAREALIRHSRNSESRRGISAALELAKKHLAITTEEMDRDPLLINCQNGTFDVRTGELRNHRREDLISCITQSVYHPDAVDERLGCFLSDVVGGDQELLAFLQRSAGYSLTGMTSSKAIFLVVGPPDTGKTTFFEAIASAGGTYSRNADFETFLARKDVGGPRPDIARLAGARYVYAVETDAGSSLAAGKVKLMSGSDKITARFLHAREFEFIPRFKLWLAANDAPTVRHADDALWNRLQRIPFLHKPVQKDPQLLEHLRGDAAPALLRWLLNGAAAWYRQGIGTAKAVEDAKAAYRAEMDPLTPYFEDKAVFGEGKWIASSFLWEDYGQWASRQSGVDKVTRKEFYEALRLRGCEPEKRNDLRGWSGVDLIPWSPRRSD